MTNPPNNELVLVAAAKSRADAGISENTDNAAAYVTGFEMGAKWQREISGDEDPTPWCSGCGAKTKSKCNCGEIADNE